MYQENPEILHNTLLKRALAAGFTLRKRNNGRRYVCSCAIRGGKPYVHVESNPRQRRKMTGDQINCPYHIVVPKKGPLHRGRHPQPHARDCPIVEPKAIRDMYDPDVIAAALADCRPPAKVVADLLDRGKNITNKDISNIRRRHNKKQVRTDILADVMVTHASK